jgi:hypothetical protein
VRNFHFALISLALLLLTLYPTTPAQEDNEAAKAEALIRGAIQARGGDAYLKIRTAVSHGQYTPYDKGVSTIPRPFVDYIVYPDRERTEFDKGDHKYIQTNAGNEGWIYDATQKMIRPQTEDQVKDFKQGLRADLDYLLRQGWQEAGAKLVYIGRREVQHNVFSEAVRIDFADGYSVTLHFDTRTKLPLLTEYKKTTEEGTGQYQLWYFSWLDYAGIKAPRIQDLYRDGKQLSRVYVETVSFNTEVPDKLFLKPASIKEVK